MQSRFRFISIFFVALALQSPLASAETAPDAKIDQSDVLAYLDTVVEWQRTAMAIEPAINNARERIYRDSMQQNAIKVLENGFAFSRAQALLLQTSAAQSDATDTDDNPETESPQQRLTKRAHEVDEQIASLTTQRAHAKAKQRQEIDDQIKLLNARKELLQAVLANMNLAGDNTPKGFFNKISDLERSIPELNPEPAKPVAKPTPTSTAADADTTTTYARPTRSIIGLATSIFDISRKQRELKAFATQTAQLETATQTLMKSLRTALESQPSAGAKPLTIDQRVAIYKQVGGAIVPLGKTRVWINASEHTLRNWQEVLDTQLNTNLRQLAVRLGMLAIALSIPLIMSHMAHRGITQYVSDPKRQNQLNTARRIIAAVAIVFILLGTFISDFSSFATFAGFITAGLALALQSVLLSFVAHFFFYGRYGVRAGDRVNVAGVTGDIVQIGMVRMYMRELREGEHGLEPTGKIVAFPNAILFQNTAFYKYV